MRITTFATAFVVLLSTSLAAQTLDFEDLTLGDVYDPNPATLDPDSFMTGGIPVTVNDFVFSGGGTTSLGFTEVENGGLAGGSGNELEVNNVNLDFNFGGPVQTVGITFGEFGGNINFEVNGDFHNVANFQALPGTIGGATYSVSPTSVAGSVMTVQGAINSLSIGGQELWIDNVRYVVPEPAATGLIGLVLTAMFFKRRRVSSR